MPKARRDLESSLTRSAVFPLLLHPMILSINTSSFDGRLHRIQIELTSHVFPEILPRAQIDQSISTTYFKSCNSQWRTRSCLMAQRKRVGLHGLLPVRVVTNLPQSSSTGSSCRGIKTSPQHR